MILFKVQVSKDLALKDLFLFENTEKWALENRLWKSNITNMTYNISQSDTEEIFLRKKKTEVFYESLELWYSDSHVNDLVLAEKYRGRKYQMKDKLLEWKYPVNPSKKSSNKTQHEQKESIAQTEEKENSGESQRKGENLISLVLQKLLNELGMEDAGDSQALFRGMAFDSNPLVLIKEKNKFINQALRYALRLIALDLLQSISQSNRDEKSENIMIFREDLIKSTKKSILLFSSEFEALYAEIVYQEAFEYLKNQLKPCTTPTHGKTTHPRSTRISEEIIKTVSFELDPEKQGVVSWIKSTTKDRLKRLMLRIDLIEKNEQFGKIIDFADPTTYPLFTTTNSLYLAIDDLIGSPFQLKHRNRHGNASMRDRGKLGGDSNSQRGFLLTKLKTMGLNDSSNIKEYFISEKVFSDEFYPVLLNSKAEFGEWAPKQLFHTYNNWYLRKGKKISSKLFDKKEPRLLPDEFKYLKKEYKAWKKKTGCYDRIDLLWALQKNLSWGKDALAHYILGVDQGLAASELIFLAGITQEKAVFTLQEKGLQGLSLKNLSNLLVSNTRYDRCATIEGERDKSENPQIKNSPLNHLEIGISLLVSDSLENALEQLNRAEDQDAVDLAKACIKLKKAKQLENKLTQPFPDDPQLSSTSKNLKEKVQEIMGKAKELVRQAAEIFKRLERTSEAFICLKYLKKEKAIENILNDESVSIIKANELYKQRLYLNAGRQYTRVGRGDRAIQSYSKCINKMEIRDTIDCLQYILRIFESVKSSKNAQGSKRGFQGSYELSLTRLYQEFLSKYLDLLQSNLSDKSFKLKYSSIEIKEFSTQINSMKRNPITRDPSNIEVLNFEKIASLRRKPNLIAKKFETLCLLDTKDQNKAEVFKKLEMLPSKTIEDSISSKIDENVIMTIFRFIQQSPSTKKRKALLKQTRQDSSKIQQNNYHTAKKSALQTHDVELLLEVLNDLGYSLLVDVIAQKYKFKFLTALTNGLQNCSRIWRTVSTTPRNQVLDLELSSRLRRIDGWVLQNFVQSISSEFQGEAFIKNSGSHLITLGFIRQFCSFKGGKYAKNILGMLADEDMLVHRVSILNKSSNKKEKDDMMAWRKAKGAKRIKFTLNNYNGNPEVKRAGLFRFNLEYFWELNLKDGQDIEKGLGGRYFGDLMKIWYQINFNTDKTEQAELRTSITQFTKALYKGLTHRNGDLEEAFELGFTFGLFQRIFLFHQKSISLSVVLGRDNIWPSFIKVLIRPLQKKEMLRLFVLFTNRYLDSKLLPKRRLEVLKGFLAANLITTFPKLDGYSSIFLTRRALVHRGSVFYDNNNLSSLNFYLIDSSCEFMSCSLEKAVDILARDIREKVRKMQQRSVNLETPLGAGIISPAEKEETRKNLLTATSHLKATLIESNLLEHDNIREDKKAARKVKHSQRKLAEIKADYLKLMDFDKLHLTSWLDSIRIPFPKRRQLKKAGKYDRAMEEINSIAEIDPQKLNPSQLLNYFTNAVNRDQLHLFHKLRRRLNSKGINDGVETEDPQEATRALNRLKQLQNSAFNLLDSEVSLISGNTEEFYTEMVDFIKTNLTLIQPEIVIHLIFKVAVVAIVANSRDGDLLYLNPMALKIIRAYPRLSISRGILMNALESDPNLDDLQDILEDLKTQTYLWEEDDLLYTVTELLTLNGYEVGDPDEDRFDDIDFGVFDEEGSSDDSDGNDDSWFKYDAYVGENNYDDNYEDYAIKGMLLVSQRAKFETLIQTMRSKKIISALYSFKDRLDGSVKHRDLDLQLSYDYYNQPQMTQISNLDQEVLNVFRATMSSLHLQLYVLKLFSPDQILERVRKLHDLLIKFASEYQRTGDANERNQNQIKMILSEGFDEKAVRDLFVSEQSNATLTPEDFLQQQVDKLEEIVEDLEKDKK